MNKWYESDLVFWGAVAVIVLICYLPDIIHGPETTCIDREQVLEQE